MFSTLLIANRGEIACRIIATCARLGIRSVAVFSDADRDALHVRLADQAVHIGPAPARDSYLRADRIVAAALASGAQAIHPGYGFLSERLDLIATCEAAGLVFIGPSAKAIDAMGDKIRSKRIARDAGVACVPGYDGADQSPVTLAAEALRIGLPVMVKASAGGGGKGIRKVEQEVELEGAIAAATREAQAAFGDGTLLIEKFVSRPRHVEVQVAGDRHGNLVHLFERDCSVQRANQKLIEEAPAPNLLPETRARLHEQALRLARAIGYDNLGTVEFLVDAGTQASFFLEMNTRLQVEHPVTEAVTGLDLVDWQLRIAAGERLPLAQEAITCHGHAIEARLTAERADAAFSPSGGRIALWRAPPGLRLDSGVAEGSVVTGHYDSLLAKLIAHGPDRAQAVARLASGLEQLSVLGPATTRGFLIDALRTPAFAAGAATTLFIAETWPGGWTPSEPEPGLIEALAAAIWLAQRPISAAGPWGSLNGFRLLAPAGLPTRAHLSVMRGTVSTRLAVTGAEGRFSVEIAGRAIALAIERIADTSFAIEREGRRETADAIATPEGLLLRFGAFEGSVGIMLAVEAAAREGGAGGSSDGSVRAAMPGTLAALHVATGDEVAQGQVVAVLESMKLFIELKSPAAGRVARIGARAGATVAAGDVIIALEA